MTTEKEQNQNEKICAGIITYHSIMDELIQLVDTLYNEEKIDRLYIIDNNSDNQNNLDRLKDHFKNINIIKNSQNIGVAGAINMLCRYGKKMGYEFVLPFDQDSLPERGFTRNLVSAFRQKQKEKINIAAVGPMQVDTKSGKSQPFIRFQFPLNKRLYGKKGENTIPCDFLISSGCLLSINAIEEIGLMEESFFIDNVDLEWSFRARSKEFQIFGVKNARMRHCIGEKVYKFPLFNIWIRVHRPIRTYYMTRNRLILYRRRYVPLAWKLNDIIRFIFKISFILTLTPRRKENFYFFCKAIKETLRKYSFGYPPNI